VELSRLPYMTLFFGLRLFLYIIFMVICQYMYDFFHHMYDGQTDNFLKPFFAPELSAEWGEFAISFSDGRVHALDTLGDLPPPSSYFAGQSEPGNFHKLWSPNGTCRF